MSFVQPEILPPLTALGICISVPLQQHEDLRDLFTDTTVQMDEAYQVAGNAYILRLLRSKFSPQRGHFHINILRAAGEPNDVQQLRAACDRMLGRVFDVNFQASFKLAPSVISRGTMLGAWTGTSMSVGGTTGKLVSANIVLSDSVYREVRWKREKPSSAQSDLIVELFGVLSEHPVTEDLLTIARTRCESGYRKFVHGHAPQGSQQP